LSQPLAIGKADATAVPGGPSLPPLELPDLDAGDGAALPAGVPGGVSDVAPQLTAVLNAADPTLPIVATALVIAAGLGAYHALTPGHGKTVMAAYLVGTRGNAGHALMLAATVAAAHTLGVLGLAAVVFAAERTLPPDRLLPWLGLASGFVFLTVGASLVRSRVAELLARRAHAREHALDHHSGATLVAGGHDHAGEHDHAGGHHGHEHAHADQGAALSVRSLFALGLSGGLVPAPSALLVFLGSVTLGRPIYGFVLVLAFGLGMAAVLGGVGLLVIRAKDGMQRRFERVRFGPVVTAVQFGAAVVVLAVGVVMTIQSGTRVF
jgi:ABC-type nickel/cobalt efflux system permease component RcnA